MGYAYARAQSCDSARGSARVRVQAAKYCLLIHKRRPVCTQSCLLAGNRKTSDALCARDCGDLRILTTGHYWSMLRADMTMSQRSRVCAITGCRAARVLASVWLGINLCGCVGSSAVRGTDHHSKDLPYPCKPPPSHSITMKHTIQFGTYSLGSPYCWQATLDQTGVLRVDRGGGLIMRQLTSTEMTNVEHAIELSDPFNCHDQISPSQSSCDPPFIVIRISNEHDAKYILFHIDCFDDPSKCFSFNRRTNSKTETTNSREVERIQILWRTLATISARREDLGSRINK